MNTQQHDNLEILAFGQTTVSKFRKLKIFLYGLKGVSNQNKLCPHFCLKSLAFKR